MKRGTIISFSSEPYLYKGDRNRKKHNYKVKKLFLSGSVGLFFSCHREIGHSPLYVLLDNTPYGRQKGGGYIKSLSSRGEVHPLQGTAHTGITSLARGSEIVFKCMRIVRNEYLAGLFGFILY